MEVINLEYNNMKDFMSETRLPYNISIENSKYIKGLALLMMVYHHFFGFPDRLLGSNAYNEIVLSGHHLDYLLASACKLCVCIFAWCSGYGMYYVYNREGEKTGDIIRECFRRIMKLLEIYWLVLISFYCPVSVMFNGEISLVGMIRNICLINL